MKRKLFINLIENHLNNMDELLKTIKKVGFDGVNFTWNNQNDFTTLVNKIKEYGLSIDYIHAPFNNINHFWYENSAVKDSLLNDLKSCVDFCKEIKVNKMVVHPFIGFDEHNPTLTGINYFEKLLKYAKSNNILICFENVEGEEYLSFIYTHLFKKYDNARFCLDTGHELCYNKGEDQLSKYGNFLSCTHINDNVGITGSTIWWTDDLHYIPGDGILDIENLVSRLKRINYKGNLSLEIKINHIYETNIYNNYKQMSLENYYLKAFNALINIKNKLDKE